MIAVLLPACASLETNDGDTAVQSTATSVTPIGSADILAATLRLDFDNCRLAHQRATAVRISEDLAATVAHSFFVDGQLSVEQLDVFDHSGALLQAEVAFLDESTDVALIRIPEPGPHLPLGPFTDDTESQDHSRLVVYPERDLSPEIVDISIVRQVELTLDGAGARQGLEIEGVINPGDSGAPVLNDHGVVVGIAFASSKTAERGWAIASSEYEAAMAQISDPIRLSCPNG